VLGGREPRGIDVVVWVGRVGRSSCVRGMRDLMERVKGVVEGAGFNAFVVRVVRHEFEFLPYAAIEGSCEDEGGVCELRVTIPREGLSGEDVEVVEAVVRHWLNYVRESANPFKLIELVKSLLPLINKLKYKEGNGVWFNATFRSYNSFVTVGESYV